MLSWLFQEKLPKLIFDDKVTKQSMTKKSPSADEMMDSDESSVQLQKRQLLESPLQREGALQEKLLKGHM